MALKVILACFSLAIAASTAAPQTSPCYKLLVDAGFSSNFNETIAHAIHSMTVQGLQKFNSRATEDNSIPTVNMDRHAPEKVLPYAPNDPIGSDFSTPSMNTIDKILSNIGMDNDGLGPNWSPVERIVHKFHMMDVWDRVHAKYLSTVVTSPPSDEICSCLMDTHGNGIFQAVNWVSDHYDSGTPITLLNRPIPKLTDADSWAVWKARLLYYYKPRSLEDAAYFLYCATKEF